MSGLFLGRTALILLIPAVVVFGAFMFGAGFMSGTFYSERVPPPETVIRHEQPARSDTLTNLAQQPASSGEEQKQVVAESMAQTTGSLEAGQEGGQETADGEQQAAQPQQPEQQAAEEAPQADLDPAARDRALAELRAGESDQARQEQQQDTEAQQPAQNAETPAAAQDAPASGQQYTFQVGAFLEQTNAAELAATLISRGYESWVVSHRDGQGRLWHAVRVGRYPNKEEADSAAAAFRQREGVNAVAVPLEQGNVTSTQAPVAAPQQKPIYVVYVGAYRNAQAARDAARPLLEQGYVPCVASILDSQHQTWHIVEVVEFPTRAEAETFMVQNSQRQGAPSLKLREILPDAIEDKHCF